MKFNKIILITLVLGIMALGISGVSSASYSIDDSNYNTYFDSNGNILGTSINDGDTLNFGSLSNKDVVLSKNVTVSSSGSNKVRNGTITLTVNGSTLTNLNIDNINKNAINVNGASHISIIDNIITVTGDNPGYYSPTAIYIDGFTSYITIRGNDITVKGNGAYNYGITNNIWDFDYNTYESFLKIDQTLHNFVIEDNDIVVNTTGVYGAGIYTSTISNYHIDVNRITVDATRFIYGIVVNDESKAANSNLSTVENVKILNNNVTGIGPISTTENEGSVNYLIELYLAGNTIIEGNILYGEGNGVMGVAAFATNNTTINDNHITIISGDLYYIDNDANYDAIEAENIAIFLTGNDTATSGNSTIINNSLYLDPSFAEGVVFPEDENIFEDNNPITPLPRILDPEDLTDPEDPNTPNFWNWLLNIFKWLFKWF